MKTNLFDLWAHLKQRALQKIMPIFLLLFTVATHAQDPAQYGTPFANVPNPMDVNLYQVNIRPFSAAGNLAGVTARLDNIKAVGTNVIYLMPVYPHGTDSRSSVSPYCIKDFQSVGTEYGSLTDLRALVDGAHSRGMAVILDFVVNGSSWDHPWITQHPDWYNRDGNGNILQLATFPDIAGFNFASTSMRTAIVNAMRYWVFASNIDGFRCDFANNAPLDFWTQAINNLRGISSHKLLMFAEGDRQANFQSGFDYNFGDQFYYNALKKIALNGENVSTDIVNSTNYEYANATGTQQVIRYTDNHDVDGSGDGNPLKIFKSPAGVMANFVVCAYMQGVPFLFGSQEVAFTQQIFWPYTNVKIDWSQNANVTAEFTKVLNYRTNSTAIRRGAMTSFGDANVCAFTKINGSEKVVVMVNLRNASSTYAIPAAFGGSYKDAYTGATVSLSSGAIQNLSAFQYLVLTNANVTQVAVTDVTVSPTSTTIGINATQQITATILPSNASNKTVTYSSSNTAVATVSSTGLVTGVSAGSATITATTQDGGKTAAANITVSNNGLTTYYQIVNRYVSNAYLYDPGNGKVAYGTSASGNSYQWSKVDAGGGFYLLKNRATGNLMNVEMQNGNVEATTANTTWYSAMWSSATATNGYSYIQNRWKTNEWIHIENQTGFAQYAGPQTGWYSAMWQFVNPVTQ
jgi:glycosidase